MEPATKVDSIFFCVLIHSYTMSRIIAFIAGYPDLSGYDKQRIVIPAQVGIHNEHFKREMVLSSTFRYRQQYLYCPLMIVLLREAERGESVNAHGIRVGAVI